MKKHTNTTTQNLAIVIIIILSIAIISIVWPVKGHTKTRYEIEATVSFPLKIFKGKNYLHYFLDEGQMTLQGRTMHLQEINHNYNYYTVHKHYNHYYDSPSQEAYKSLESITPNKRKTYDNTLN